MKPTIRIEQTHRDYGVWFLVVIVLAVFAFALFTVTKTPTIISPVPEPTVAVPTGVPGPSGASGVVGATGATGSTGVETTVTP